MTRKIKTYHFNSAYVNGAWAENVRMHVGDSGLITAIEADCEPLRDDIAILGHAIPSIANTHSHAFQRTYAGLAESDQAGATDSFWSWRKEMFAFLASLTPEDVAAISAQLYVEMLKAGYTSVAEFHYLHNDINGQAYSDKAIMSKAIIDGAKQSGIGLNLVPILYQHAGFDGGELSLGQKRFYLSSDDYADLYSQLNCEKSLGFHSLRAVYSDEMKAVLSSFKGTSVHIHIAEQQGEVDACVAAHGVRPVQYLYDSLDVDSGWCLVHSTHINAAEIELIAKSKAVVALCPSTEGNLGDGIFPIEEFLAANGRFALGTDSHVSLNPMEELRQLEYVARLRGQKRLILGGGANLWLRAGAGGAQVLGHEFGLSVGAKADILVLDQNHASYAGRKANEIFDTLVMTSHGNPIKHVLVGGNWVINDGKQKHEETILSNYNKAIISLMERR
jgi:formimidoylglutamate deiminase